jgi:hypothetical protein
MALGLDVHGSVDGGRILSLLWTVGSGIRDVIGLPLGLGAGIGRSAQVGVGW